MNRLDVKHLKKYYTSQKAVDDISFSLAPGSIFGLLGPNGAGKTTLLRMVTGILYPDEGEITFDGQLFNPDKDNAYIGYMPEEKGLYKKMKIGDQAIYLAQLKGLSKATAMERVKHWFIKFEMQSWWNKKVEDLSKGMQQKLQFVTTVLNDPKLIILDEPFSGLDPVNSNLIKEEIYMLAQNGASIIFSTHRMEQVEEICDHIILVNKGQKILDGSVNGVKQQFKEAIFSIGLDSQPGQINSPAFEIINKKEQQLILKINEGFRSNDVLHFFLQQEVGINSFQEILPSLSDIFIKLVEGTPLTRQFQTVTA
ncbi:ABC transporter ATP-binding protein [Niastella yeongjuensis]|uniref:ABC transporter ATP-binding protein n=1 Tax=Niastella yeongjuensis TaxID=354355 RepID=A0A1V9EP03_9BACT|nr:ATP-binding cassette domain-containing protein [Niastella yeongjuensis]OQP47811.1 ABC transporter ATP-binding protein [Niastella yeongjuensis]SEP45143.1 ABC-2 type transport system ATP-binding protein [Niastella yeongjuensis]